MKTLLGLAAILVTISNTAIASQITFGSASVGGNGCQNATTRWEKAPNGNLLFIVEARSKMVERKSLSRLTCTIVLPVDMSRGDVLLVKGFALVSNLEVPKKSKATMGAEVFAAGADSQKLSKNIKGGKVLFSPSLQGKNMLTLSDKPTNLRVNASVTLQNLNKSQYGQNGIQLMVLELQDK